MNKEDTIKLSYLTDVVHGDQTSQLARLFKIDRSNLVDLSKSMNPLAKDISELALNYVNVLRDYPNEEIATGCLAEAMEVRPQNIILTNGAAEAIALVAQIYPRGYFHGPEFSLYERYIETIDREQGKLWRSNPNNPTGLLAADDIKADIWDESFYQLSCGAWTRTQNDSDNVVIGSLTKLYNCPGLRIGYIMCKNEDIVSKIRSKKPYWSVNSLGVALIPELLKTTDLILWKKKIDDLKSRLVNKLNEMGYATSDSAAPYVFVYNGVDLLLPLAKRGIFVRSCKSFGLDKDIRIAVPTEENLALLLNTLEESNIQTL